MSDLAPIGEFEQMVLLAVLKVRDAAYGVSIHDELERHTKRGVARGAVYMTLDRLEKKGFLTSSLSEPTTERGGARAALLPTDQDRSGGAQSIPAHAAQPVGRPRAGPGEVTCAPFWCG